MEENNYKREESTFKKFFEGTMGVGCAYMYLKGIGYILIFLLFVFFLSYKNDNSCYQSDEDKIRPWLKGYSDNIDSSNVNKFNKIPVFDKKEIITELKEQYPDKEFLIAFTYDNPKIKAIGPVEYNYIKKLGRIYGWCWKFITEEEGVKQSGTLFVAIYDLDANFITVEKENNIFNNRIREDVFDKLNDSNLVSKPNKYINKIR